MESILANALDPKVSPLAAQEKRRLLARLLARLAHEIRNPLSSLDIHVQLLEEDLAALEAPLREKLLQRLEIIHGELHRLDNIVLHFLKLSGPSEVNLTQTDLLGLAQYVRNLLAPEAASRNIELQLHHDSPLPVVWADAGPLTQALLNLAINALQAIEQGGRIDLRLRAASAGVRVEIQDSGPGVPAGQQSMIFEPYYTTKPDGNGLGLWIAQQIISAHGSAIEVSDAPGRGAVFSFLLPAQQPAHPRGQISN